MEERLQVRVWGESNRPTLIYLPGIHGDWTLIGGFKAQVQGSFRFVEFTYPRTLTWSLEDYAAAIEQALAGVGINQGWLIGESFGSQLVWPLLKRKRLHVQGVVLAGGFVKHPLYLGVRMAERVAGGIPLRWITRILFGYAKVARFRYRHSPMTAANINEFIARRTELDRQAAVHRLRLIAAHDPREIARNAEVPVFAIAGALDPIVPWLLTKRWLRRKCGSFQEFKIIWRADHNVLGTAPELAARQIRRWMGCVTPVSAL